ncbi:hypothetical protein RI129_001800 [Pyrocoelia pectoralis]|uniref:SIAH-type domain-containing protein n=1 Tax=Pyrocoelia pectoralis TaxID=417401 RepID=A0AAN7VUN9_9COLE
MNCSKSNGNIRKVYACPSVPKNSCNWEGNAVDILKHLHKAHANMVLESNIFSVNVLCNGEENKILPSQKGLFLIQIKTLNEQMKLQLKLRFLPYKYLNIEEIRYNLEVSSGVFGFSNENYDLDFNPVCNTTDGIEVDVGAIQLIVGHGLSSLLLKVNVYENIKQLVRLPSKTDEDNASSEHVSDHVYYDYNNSPDENEDTQTQETFSLYSYELEDSERENYYTMEMLQCTNCQCTMIPPIHICPNGHNVCYNCRIGACSVCHRDITEVRNISLEDYSKTLKHPCRYEPQGCTEVCNYNEIRKHELQCSYCIYKCELCIFEGKLHDIGTHFRIVHPSTKIYDTMSGIHFRKGSNFIIMNRLGVFYCTSSATDFHIEWKVIYCGPKERFFSCDVKITGKKPNQQLKHYFLKRDDNVYKWRVKWDELKNSNVKEKYATLNISSY